MRRWISNSCWLCVLVVVCAVPITANGQPNTAAPRVFGYFQTSFHHFNQKGDDENSFNLQQLNVFLAKRITPRWRAFVNFEFTNNFSTERLWGDFSIEEAWLGYSFTRRTHLKAGLLIPIFNNLNEIKNKTPLLPYVIRPIVYEASFANDVGAESFIPRRAFMQLYGYFEAPSSKLDYAFYIGNSPNITSRVTETALQSGVDSTANFMGGGRIGIRRGEFKAGISGTYEHTNEIVEAAEYLEREPEELESVPRHRIGADLSYRWGGIVLESEYILSHYEIDAIKYNIDRRFVYVTLGYQASETLFLYGGYWWTGIDGFVVVESPGIIGTFDLFESELDLSIPVGGVAWTMNDQITLKGQFGYVDQTNTSDFEPASDYTYFVAMALSATF
jgi:hypothetical protein